MNRRGNKGGRPSINDITKDLVIKLYNANEMTCKDIATACSISVSSLYNIVRKEIEKHSDETKE